MRKKIKWTGKQRDKRQWIFFGCLLLAVLFTSAAGYFCGQGEGGRCYVSGYYTESQMSARELSQYMEKQAEKEEKAQRAAGQALGKSGSQQETWEGNTQEKNAQKEDIQEENPWKEGTQEENPETQSTGAEETDKIDTQIPQVTGWTRQDRVAFKRQDGMAEQGTLYQVCGSMEVFFPEGLRGGSLPWREDEAGCVVSTALAWELYGSRDVAGNQILAQDREYCIRGIVDSDRVFLAVQAQEKDPIQNFRLRYQSSVQPVSGAETFLYQMTGNQPEAVYEGVLYAGLARILLLVPGLLLEILALLFVRDKSRSAVQPKVGRAVRVGATLLFAALLVWEAMQAFSFSRDYLPSMWSDLSFYPGLIGEKAERTASLLEQQLCPAEERSLAWLWKTALYSGAGGMAAIATIISRAGKRQEAEIAVKS